MTMYERLNHNDIRMKQRLGGGSYVGRTISDIQFMVCTLNQFTFENCLLSSFGWQDSDLYNSNVLSTHLGEWISSGLWSKVRISDSSMNNCRFVDQEFAGCTFNGKTIISGCKFTKVVFSGCNFKNVRFENCTFNDVIFFECEFDGVHSVLKPQLNSHVLFVNCLTTKTRFRATKFNARKIPNGVIPVGRRKLSTKFESCNTAGILFTDCDLDGLDMRCLEDCIFDNEGILGEEDIHMDGNPEEPELPILSNSIASNQEELKTVEDDDDDDWDEYDIIGNIYGPYGGGMYGGGGRNYGNAYKPKNKGKPWAYRFYSAGMIPAAKAKA